MLVNPILSTCPEMSILKKKIEYIHDSWFTVYQNNLNLHTAQIFCNTHALRIIVITNMIHAHLIYSNILPVDSIHAWADHLRASDGHLVHPVVEYVGKWYRRKWEMLAVFTR